MAIPCHPPPGMSSSPVSSSTRDPYKTLGLDHNATLAQIKVAYRKLALRYHPDRQRPTSPVSAAGQSCVGDASSAVSSREEATAKFAEVAAAYAILSDPVRKKEYDHLYKFGAFDDTNNYSVGDENEGGRANGVRSPTSNNYRYTEDFSGGYYKPGYKPPAPGSAAAQASPFQRQQAAAAAAAAFQSMQSQDSFFDDLIYSPRSKGDPSSSTAFDFNEDDKNTPSEATRDDSNGGGETTAPPRKKQPGIGFSFTPLGKHLSIHVPSRTEILTSMTQQPPPRAGAAGNKPRASHLFGTRVTFSQQTTSGLGKLERIANCGATNTSLNQKKVVSTTTTRIAKGQRRILKRTALLHPDGRKEVVIEENGVVRRRYVEENPNNNGSDSGSDHAQRRDDSETTTGHGNEQEGSGGLQKEDSGKFTLLGLFKSCLAPCASAAG